MQLTLILGLFSHCWSCVKENQTKYYSAAEKQGPNSDPVYMGDHSQEFQHGSDFNITANVIFFLFLSKIPFVLTNGPLIILLLTALFWKIVYKKLITNTFIACITRIRAQLCNTK